MVTIREAYLMGKEHLAASGSGEAGIESEVLLRHVLGLDRTALYARWNGAMAQAARDTFQKVLEERATGRPVPYIIGEREFMGLAFAVDERVMIPRPETEVLVEFAVNSVRNRFQSGERVIDIGTGSGCIAVSVAHFLPTTTVFATDISPRALEVARANAIRHGVHRRITFLEGDLWGPLPPDITGRIDAVISNPPYVPSAQRGTLPREIRDFEPAVAVCIDGDGIAVHRRLIADATRWLSPSGLLAMEVAAGQAQAVVDIMRRSARYDHVTALPDYSGILRVVAGELMA